jgi:hypothetical protein
MRTRRIISRVNPLSDLRMQRPSATRGTETLALTEKTKISGMALYFFQDLEFVH